ncbi:alpha 1,2-mannosyltransferase 2.4.1 [Linnemannia gamsii]|uniref:Alpha 1,2-mannosyltransferase 2.4.1 n=1 Tax=Linnemannia gamsii TaxID=64522 RepID=A0ABQ7K836_9FUNG|nr:alpha 1,2-mannosyltransferase 2.4.1 [Linnemannia gamsii]
MHYGSRHHSATISTRIPAHGDLAAVDTSGGSPPLLQEKQQGAVHRTRQSQQQPSLNAPSNKNSKKTAIAPKKNRKNTILIQKPFPPKPPVRRANAAFVMLVRNSDGQGARSAVRQIEDRFNRNFQYPYVFLNDAPFTEEFKALVRPMSKANMTFGLVPEEHWSYPEWISTTKAKEARKTMAKVVYGWSESYRHMCRYQSGFFFQHEAMLPFDYYWRIEPDVEYSCDLDFDPFLFMQDNNKKYAFTMSLPEYTETIPSLWNVTKDFMDKYPHLLAEKNALDFISDDGGKTYNMCHFWSNFEIADARWMRGEAYQQYFKHLDQAGGFFYERWGDAPVHSIAAALLLPIDQIHFFKEIGYYHAPFYNCPAEPEFQAKCHCDPYQNVNRERMSCTIKFLELAGEKGMVFPEEIFD